MSAPATAGHGTQPAPAQEAPGPGRGRDWLRELARASAGPVICAAVLIGLLVCALLVLGGLFLVYALRDTSQLQDCVMQGRSNCASITSSSPSG